jgi:hypothetical protein
VHAVKAYGEKDIQLNSSFNLVQSLSCSGHFTLRPKSTWCSLSKQLVGPQSQSGCSGEEQNLLSLLHIEPQLLNHPASSLFTIPTMLSLFTTLIQDILYFHHCYVLSVSWCCDYEKPVFIIALCRVKLGFLVGVIIHCSWMQWNLLRSSVMSACNEC